MIRKYDMCYIVTSHKILQVKYLKLSFTQAYPTFLFYQSLINVDRCLSVISISKKLQCFFHYTISTFICLLA